MEYHYCVKPLLASCRASKHDLPPRLASACQLKMPGFGQTFLATSPLFAQVIFVECCNLADMTSKGSVQLVPVSVPLSKTILRCDGGVRYEGVDSLELKKKRVGRVFKQKSEWNWFVVHFSHCYTGWPDRPSGRDMQTCICKVARQALYPRANTGPVLIASCTSEARMAEPKQALVEDIPSNLDILCNPCVEPFGLQSLTCVDSLLMQKYS